MASFHEIAVRRPGPVMAARVLVGCGVLVLCAGPWLFPPTDLKLFTEVFCVLGLATMWNLLAGFVDIVTVGQQAFVGIGAYALFGFTMLGHWSPVWAILMSPLIAGALAIPMLLVIFRLRAAYLAVGTWVVSEIALLIAGRLPGFGLGAGASFSTSVIKAFGARAAVRYETFYILSFVLMLLAFGCTWALLRSRHGLGLKGIRDNEDGAASVGVDLRTLRIGCFLFTAPFIGLTGALIALQKARISPDGSFSITDFTVYIIFIVIVGGIGSLEGPIIGTILFFVLRGVLSDFGTVYLIALGSISIVVILTEPRGIWGVLKSRVIKGDIFACTKEPGL
jgi:branched-chain amino acid transport system permease protein